MVKLETMVTNEHVSTALHAHSCGDFSNVKLKRFSEAGKEQDSTKQRALWYFHLLKQKHVAGTGEPFSEGFGLKPVLFQVSKDNCAMCFGANSGLCKVWFFSEK